MILIWVDETNRKGYEVFLSLIKKKRKVELVFEQDGKFYEGYFDPKMLSNKDKVYYSLPSTKRKLDKRFRKIIKNPRKSEIKNYFVKIAIEAFNMPLFYSKIKYIRKKETIAKKFLDTNKIILLYKDYTSWNEL